MSYETLVNEVYELARERFNNGQMAFIPTKEQLIEWEIPYEIIKEYDEAMGEFNIA